MLTIYICGDIIQTSQIVNEIKPNEKERKVTIIMKKKITLIVSLIVVAALAITVFAACGKKDTTTPSDDTSSSSDSGSAAKKTLTLATSADFPPYEYMEGKNFKGIDIEVAGLIAEKLGCELVVSNMNFNSILNAVQSGKADMGMAGLTVTPDRLESVDFSDSYATGVQVLIVKDGSSITSVDDLYDESKGLGEGLKVGVQLSTTGDIYISGDVSDGKTKVEVKQFAMGAEAVAALSSGKIDAVLIDSEPAKSFVAANEGLKILDGEYAVEDYAIAFAKNSELKDQVNTALKELIADGSVKAIVDKYIPAD